MVDPISFFSFCLNPPFVSIPSVPNKIYTQLQVAKYQCFLFKNHQINFHPYDLDTFFVVMYLDMLRSILGESKLVHSKNSNELVVEFKFDHFNAFMSCS